MNTSPRKIIIVGASSGIGRKLAECYAEKGDLVGISGWTGAGLLGAVLAWLTLKYIPAKDAQLMELLKLHQADRDADRLSRHELATKFEASMGSVVKHCEDENNKLQKTFEQTMAKFGKPQ